MRAIVEGAPAARIDVGRVRYRSDAGAAQERFFLNMASAGVTGLVCRLVEQSGKQLGGRITFYIATLRALAQYKPARVRMLLDGQLLLGEPVPITTLVVCNSQYAGGGMRFGPRARLTDGQLDIVCIQPTSLWAQFKDTPKLYNGEHTGLPYVSQHRGRHLLVEVVDDKPAYVEFDGEAPGFAPVEYEVVPAALPVLGLQPFVL
jgi:diacylglycerol kinase family enzyme